MLATSWVRIDFVNLRHLLTLSSFPLQVNRRLQTVVSLHEGHLARTINDRQLARLKAEVHSLDFRDVPIDIAFRRFTARFDGLYSRWGRYAISRHFCEAYWDASPRSTFQSWEDVHALVSFLVLVSDWLHYRDVQNEEIRLLNVRYGGLNWEDALTKATGQSNVAKESKYQKLVENFTKYVSGSVEPDEIIRMFEVMRAAPLIKREESVEPSRMFPKRLGSPRRLPEVLKETIGLPNDVHGFLPLLGISWDSVCARKILDRFREAGKLDCLAWAALLEEIEVDWL